MDNASGVGVLDKAALVLSALEPGPATLAGLVAATGLARPTAHRLAELFAERERLRAPCGVSPRITDTRGALIGA